MSEVLTVVGYFVGAITGNWWVFAAGLQGIYQEGVQRRDRRRAIAEYNASLQDRLEMVDLLPDAPRSLVLGRVRYVEGVRRRWVSGTNSEKLTLLVSFAGHEIDGFEQWYLDEKPVTLDAGGWVLTAPYFKGTLTSHRMGVSSTTVDLGSVPVAGSVVMSWESNEGSGITAGSQPADSVVGTVATFPWLPPAGLVVVTWQTADNTSRGRIRAWRGAPGQNVGAELAAEYPGKITATDRFEGIALAAVDVLYDQDVFPQGGPNVTCVLRGARVLDTRTGITAWSENPALHAYHYARWANGYDLPADEINTADISAAADVCDVSTNFVTRNADGSGYTTVTLPRHRCGITISSAADPRESMHDILATMAGRAGWAGGTWRLRAGTMAAPAFTLDTTWLAQPLAADGMPDSAPVVRFANGITRDQKINFVSGTCVDPDQRWQALPFPARRDPVLIASQGKYATAITLPGVNHVVHAQHLANVTIRENQAALRGELACNLSAYRCELFDVGTLLLPRYGMTEGLAKTVEVLGWRWHPTQGVQLQVAEISAAIYTPVAELDGRDPAPNSVLPSLGTVEQLAITGITDDLVRLGDGTIATRARVAWGAAVSAAITSAGQIEVQYTPAAAALPAGDWPSWIEGGSATGATIDGLRDDTVYLFRVRAIKPGLGVRGPWSLQVAHRVLGKTAPPANVASVSWALEPFGVRLSWPAVPDLDVATYEVRQGAGPWESATLLAQASALSWLWGVQGVGSQTVQVKALDTSGNYSTAAASVVVTITAPAAPVLSYALAGPDELLTWTVPVAASAIDRYELRHGSTWAGGTSLGTVKGTTFKRRADYSGARRYWAAAIDAAGNVGAAGSVDVTVSAPGTVTAQRAEVVDNNVLLYWATPATGSLPVERYDVRRGSTWAGGTPLGSNGNSTFTTYFEQQSGNYAYWVAAVDTAGNTGTAVAITATVNQPPDYVLRADYNDDFVGITLSGMYVEAGRVYGPALGETIQAHFEGRGWATPDDQITAGYPLVFQPGGTTGYVERTMDYGALLPSTIITVTAASTVLAGAVAVAVQLSYKALAGDAWTDATAGATQALASGFRYVKVRLTFTATGGDDLIELQGLNIKLSGKLKTDSGSGSAVSTDSGGTSVAFGIAFIDVDSINVTAGGTAQRTAIYNFTDVPNPTGFKVLLFDSAGARVSGPFSWTARGY